MPPDGAPQPAGGPIQRRRGLFEQLEWNETAAELADSDLLAFTARAAWCRQARAEQRAPKGDWRLWVELAGRGFGKTRSAAEEMWWRRYRYPGTIGHVIARTTEDHRKTTFDGPSGINSLVPRELIAHATKVPYSLTFTNGSKILAFSAQEYDSLRGPQAHESWADEPAAWQYPDLAWDQVELSTRLVLPDGSPSRIYATSTPRPIKLVKSWVERHDAGDPSIRLVRGSTYANRANLDPAWFDTLLARYKGTRAEAQELEAVLLLDVPGALWEWSTIFAGRVSEPPATLRRVTIGVDPATSSNESSNENGIVAFGVGDDGHGYVLEDATLVAGPDAWGRAAVELHDRLKADDIVAEVNQGGDMVESTIRICAREMYREKLRSTPEIAIRKVHATRGKAIRAEPIAALAKQGRIHHVGEFSELEIQLTSFTPDMDRRKMGSPDRLDAMVWAATHCMLKTTADLTTVRPVDLSRMAPFILR